MDGHSSYRIVQPSQRAPRPEEGATVLLVDEDESWRTQAAAALYHRGYDVMSLADRWQIAEMLDEAAPDLVVLCAASPKHDARLSRLLAQWPPPPHLLLLCPADQLDQRAASMAAGASECLPKPRNPRGLCDVVDRLLPSIPMHPERGETVKFDGWRLNPHNARLVAPTGAAAILLPSDFRLLRAFLAHRGQVLGRDRLHRLCGMHEHISELALACRVSRLRSTLRRLAPQHADLIRTVWGEGYVFVGRAIGDQSRG